ncbi:MAG TPA: polysaccharide deacetylase family protein [Clostridia bacterium]|jgi:polysaccharide deacetylase family sporulation protein PdaB
MYFITLKLKDLLRWVGLIALLAVLISLNALTGSANVYLTSTAPRKLPIYSVETQENKIAISFDAAWGADKTDELISILKENDIKATFFLVGFWAEKYSDKVKALDENGFEIGTHSNTHPDMTKLSRERMRLELEASINILQNITGKKPKVFRPPFGAYNNALIETAESLGLKTIQWDVDSLDWKNYSAQEIAQRVISKTQKGSIILMHNNGEHTPQALKLIILGLKNKGFEFVCVSDLIYHDDYYIDHTGRQIKNSR